MTKFNEKQIILMNNIPTPYRSSLFQHFAKICNLNDKTFEILYLAKTETVRNWEVDISSFEKILPILVQFRNHFTPTSDVILNSGFLKKALSAEVFVVFGYNYSSYIMSALIRKIKGLETTLFCETTMFDSKPIPWKRFVKRLLLTILFTKYLVPGEASRRYLIDLGIDDINIEVVGNSANDNIVNLEKTKYHKTLKKSGQLKLLYIGRLSKEKRILQFTKVFLNLNLKNITFTIVGDGPQYEALQEIVQCDSRIKIFRKINNEMLSEVYSEHDVLVLVSDSEPWGIVVNEAIANGLALILSRKVGSHFELLKDNGCFLEDFNEKELKEVLECIVNNFSKFSANSLEISEFYTAEKIAENMYAALLK